MKNTMKNKTFIRPPSNFNEPRDTIVVGRRVSIISVCDTRGRKGTVTEVTSNRVSVALDGMVDIRRYHAKSLEVLREQRSVVPPKLSHSPDIIPTNSIDEPYYYDRRDYSMSPMPTETQKEFRLRRIEEALCCGNDDDRKLQREVDAMERSEEFPNELSIAQCLANEFDIELWKVHDLIPSYEKLMQHFRYLRQDNLDRMDRRRY
jgi:hypothetical protein